MPSENVKNKWKKCVLIRACITFRNKEVPVWYAGMYLPISSTAAV
jgi:hypothetical protein